ncbi:hypothetical protein Tco_1523124 [Tanacetum coccineum]
MGAGEGRGARWGESLMDMSILSWEGKHRSIDGALDRFELCDSSAKGAMFSSMARAHSLTTTLRSALKRIVTASGPGFGEWQWRLATLPFAFGGLGVYSAGDVLNYAFIASRLQSAALQTKLLLHVGVPLFAISKLCLACSKVFTGDVYGDHVVSCAGISAGKEVDIRLDGGCDKALRPADMLLYSWDGGLDVCVDLTGSSPLTRTGMADFVPGRAAIDVHKCKR